VLVAGCGTGAHAVKVASRYAGARVLAVDLSRASLAYAQRQAGALGLDGIRFAQADILGLGSLEDRFDLIECSGVLHHLADPEAGWQVLTGLLAPGGLMKIGLYSRAGRHAIDAARALVAERGWPPTLQGMRAARAAIRALPADHPAAPVADELDFCAASSCRDLLFHVQEVAFTLDRVATALAALDLDFLGFELFDPNLRTAFQARFPEPDALRDLAAWAAFEADNPDAFRTMYQFWCRPRPG
jgi:SAM-dependent methyltransferase